MGASRGCCAADGIGFGPPIKSGAMEGRVAGMVEGGGGNDERRWGRGVGAALVEIPAASAGMTDLAGGYDGILCAWYDEVKGEWRRGEWWV